MATASERTNIIKLVTAMFNAAPGSVYLSELVSYYDATGGTAAQKLAAVANALGNTGAYKNINPTFQTASEFATKFLTQYGLEGNQEAIDFITAKFNAGVAKGQIAYEATLAINNTTADAFASARAIMNNKTEVAEYFSVTKAIAQTDVSQLTSVISSVTATAASVTSAKTAVDNGTGATAATSFTLTTGVDSLTGTSGNDTFTADNSGTAKQLSASDSINGGAGTDTLKVFLAAADAINTQSFGTLTSIESILLNSGTLTDTTSLSVAGLTGVTSFEVDSPATLATGSAFTFTMGAGQTIGLTKVNAATGTTNAKINLGSATTVTSLTVNANASGTNSTNNGTVNVDITGTGVATLNLNGVSAASKLTLANTGAALKTINITGTVGQTLAAPLAAVNTIDASAATGAVSVDVSGAARQAAFKFTGGTAGDTLTLAAGDFATLTSASQLDGGAGTDTLVIKDTTPAYTALNLVKNFEVLGLGVTGTTVDASLLTSFKSFSFGAVAAETINNLGSGTTVTTTGNNTTVTLGAAVGNTSTSVVIGAATSAGITVGTLSVTGLTTIGLASNGTAANTITTLTNSDNTVLTVTGAAGLTITNAIAGTTTGSKVDASASTGALSVIGSAKNDILIGGSAADTLQGAVAGTANQADTLTGGAGADKFVFTSATGAAFFAQSAGTSAVVKITDFTAGVDKFNFVTTGTAFTGATVAAAQTIATAADLTAVYAGITAIAASTATNVSASVITVSAGAAAGTYLYVNDAAGGTVSNSADMLINITGVSGVITAADFTFA